MIVADPGVYAPQQDSRLLIDALREASMPSGARVLDLCTGSGVVAVAAAELGASEVLAYDISAAAVRCAQRNAVLAGVAVDVRLGGLPDALASGPFDVVVCNPPYVPAPSGTDSVLAWDAGPDGRLMLDPLCNCVDELLNDGGFVLIVHSELSAPAASIRQLRSTGLKASVVARRTIEFGPVMAERATWLESTGALAPGQRTEELAVIRGDRPEPDGR